MRRYRFLTKDYVYQALNKLRAAFLAARDGNEVEEIIMSVLTHDERMKVGRRIQIAQMLKEGYTYALIKGELKVGPPTITLVEKKMNQHPLGFDLINKREDRVEKEYKRKAYEKKGGSKMVFKRKVYTGFRRKDVER
ncbi:MAG: Trp family transcriptional regulator [Patescibacteria group bacterium]